MFIFGDVQMKNKAGKFKKLILFLLCLVPAAVSIFFLPEAGSEEYRDVYSSYAGSLELYYDDYLDGSYYTEFEIIDPGKPDSYKVGYGVPSGIKDKAVISEEKGVLHATGTGSAIVSFDGKIYSVTVKPAPISMFLMIGQSNMYGSEGSEARSVVNKNGTAYSTFGRSSTMTKDNAAQFVPSALSGNNSVVSYVGTKQLLKKSPVNSLTQAGEGKIGLDSAFASRWHSLTGDKVWLVNAAHTGKAIKKWVRGAKEYNEAVALFKAAQQVMKKEIAAGHYVLKDYGYFWFHGCSDRDNTASSYVQDFLSMHKGLKQDLMFDINSDGTADTLRFCNVIMPRAGKEGSVAYRTGKYKDSTDAKYPESFYDLEMRGQRVALYWLVNNPEFKDINLVCNIGDSWGTMPDGSDGVKEYFLSKYKNGRVDYVTQKPQKEKWRCPETPADVHDTVHYNQIGYNEIGVEAALNSAYTLGRIEKPQDVKTTVKFYDWTGYRQVSKIRASIYNDSQTLVVPVVSPVYESKNVSYGLSPNLSYSYYDLKASLGTEGGFLTSTGADENAAVKVVGKAEKQKGLIAFCWVGTVFGLQQKTENPYMPNKLSVIKGEGTSVKNSVHNNAVYRAAESITLKADRKWTFEWTGNICENTEKDNSFVMFSEGFNVRDSYGKEKKYIKFDYNAKDKTVSIIIGYGERKPIVCDVTKAVKDVTQAHTFRLYNQLLPDGTNVVKINVDKKFICEVPELNAVDFAFNYIGAKENEISNYKINRICVYEDCYCDILGHSYYVSKNKDHPEDKGRYTYRCTCGYFYRSDKK